MLGAGGGWCESSELFDGEGEARVERTSGFFASIAGGVIPAVGEREDEFPEIASNFLLWGETTSTFAFRDCTDPLEWSVASS